MGYFMRQKYLVLLGVLAISAMVASGFLLLHTTLFLVPLPLFAATWVAYAVRPLWQRQVTSGSYIPGDMLLGFILTFATWSLLAAEIPLVMILVLSFLWPALTSRLRIRWRVADYWFRATAMWTSALAGAMFEYGLRGAYFAVNGPPRLPSGEIARLAPIPFLTDAPGQILAHTNFHDLSSAGLILMGAVLLVGLAWGVLWRGGQWGTLTLLAGGLPLAILTVWAGEWHGYAHHTQGFAALWILGMIGTVVGTALKQRTSPELSVRD